MNLTKGASLRRQYIARMNRLEPIDAARALVEERFPEATAAFLTGSVVTPMRMILARRIGSM